MSSRVSAHHLHKTTLAYRSVSGHWLVRRQRALMWTAVLVAALMATLVWGPQAIRKLELMYWQARCLRYVPPADIVAASDTTRHVPREWARFYQLLSPPGMSSDGTAFLGERISPAGNRRLIALDVVGYETDHDVRVIARVFVPGGVLARPRELLRAGASRQLPAAAQVTAGRADSADPSHFSFTYRSSDAETVIDGWLRDDDTVLLEPRGK